MVQPLISVSFSYILNAKYNIWSLTSLLKNCTVAEYFWLRRVVLEKEVQSFVRVYEKVFQRKLYSLIAFYRISDYAEWLQNYQYAPRDFLKAPLSRNSTAFSFPKGKARHFETPLQSALREFKEETGLRVQNSQSLQFLSLSISGFNFRKCEFFLWFWKIEEELRPRPVIKDHSEIYRADWISILSLKSSRNSDFFFLNRRSEGSDLRGCKVEIDSISSYALQKIKNTFLQVR
jgi:8-oxo-dGTP pyrophosphatase MutT (NUDIX family)